MWYGEWLTQGPGTVVFPGREQRVGLELKVASVGISHSGEYSARSPLAEADVGECVLGVRSVSLARP